MKRNGISLYSETDSCVELQYWLGNVLTISFSQYIHPKTRKSFKVKLVEGSVGNSVAIEKGARL